MKGLSTIRNDHIDRIAARQGMGSQIKINHDRACNKSVAKPIDVALPKSGERTIIIQDSKNAID